MKKLLLGLSAAALLVACGPKENEFSLTLNVPEGVEGPVKLALEDNEIIFEGEISGGTLTANVPNFEHQYAMIQIANLPEPVVYYHDGANVTVSFTDEGGYDIQAGAMQDSAQALKDRGAIFDATMKELEGKFMQARANQDSITQEAIRAEALNLISEEGKMTLRFAKKNDILGAAIVLAANSSDYTIEDYEAVLNQVSPEYQSAPDYQKLADFINEMKRSSVGSTFTDFYQATPEGDSLSILSVEGTYVLVDFWASWCQPCRAANPALVNLYNTFNERGFNIVGISLDQDANKWKQGIADDGLNWPQVSDLQGWRNEISTYYAIQYIPQNLLLDDNGVIVGKNMSPEELTVFLEENLN